MLAFSVRHSVVRLGAALAVCLALSTVSARLAHAQIGSDRYSSIVIDAASGSILSAVNADEQRYPASLTKMMTLYMLFEAIRDRRVSLDQYVPVSPNAASMQPTKLGLVPGSLITVEQAIMGLVTKSANDAASALGEMLGGDEDRFAQMMTLRARALGLTGTNFRNASGLPDLDQYTTARDMAVLARHLIQDFPGFYHYFSTPSFVFHGRLIRTHQHMLETYPGNDGLKTGYIRDSGYNIATSAVHSDRRIIGVVMGASSEGTRDAHMATLLDEGFDRLGVAPVYLARREPPPERFPSFISVAHAAPFQLAQAAPAYAAPYSSLAARYHATRVHGAPHRGFELRSERAAPLYAFRPAATRAAFRPPAPQLRQTAAQVQVIRPTRTAHAPAYARYPG